MRLFGIAVAIVMALELVACLSIPDTTSPRLYSTIFGRAAPKCPAGSKACGVGACSKTKTVLLSNPPVPCPPPKGKPTTRAQKALEFSSNLVQRVVYGRTAPKGPASSSCSPAVTPAPKKPTKPTQTKPCTGKNCKREDRQQSSDLETTVLVNDTISTGNGILDNIRYMIADLSRRGSNKIVEMDDAKVYSCKPYFTVETRYLSVCSVLIVYTKAKVGMAHIPPSRQIGNRFTPGESVVDDHISRLRTAFGSMAGAEAVLYHQEDADPDRVEQIKNEMRKEGANLKILVYGVTFPGSGTFTISRLGENWPPYISVPT